MQTCSRSVHVLLSLAAILLAACVETTTVATDGDRAATPFEAAIERLGHRLDLPAEGKAIIVNVPHFELIAVEDGNPVLRSGIIVGTPANPTPLIDTYTSRVTFRPTWRPTPDMIASGEYEDRVWPPGLSNPLGLAAIRLEPGLLVYLHDTNQRHLFDRGHRALSHGCIRVERWDEVIAWLLGWEPARVRARANGPGTDNVPAPRVPVFIRYMRAFPGADGRVLRFPDVYGLDGPGDDDLRLTTADAPLGCVPP